MCYIEVYYLSKMNYQNRKVGYYDEKEAEIIYMRTIGKLQLEKKQAMVCLRTYEHDLIKSELLK